MTKKIILILAIVIFISINLVSGEINPISDFNKYPLDKSLTAKSRGGDLPDKISATDGVGSLLLKPINKDNSKLDNSAYNKLLRENLSKLDDNNSLNDLIVSGNISVSQDVLDKINNNIVDDNSTIQNNNSINYSCLDILNNGLSNGNGYYDITNKNDNSTFNVYCDMDNGGWTKISYTSDLEFKNWFYGEDDEAKWLPTDFSLELTNSQIDSIRSVSTEGKQIVVVDCEKTEVNDNSIDTYQGSFGLKFETNVEINNEAGSWNGIDLNTIDGISVPYDACVNNDSTKRYTEIEINRMDVPVINFESRDNGDAGENFGSVLTNHPAWFK